MTMDRNFIEHLIGVFERSTLADLEYSESGAHIRLSRGLSSAAATGNDRPVEQVKGPETTSSLALPAAVTDAPAKSTAERMVAAPVTGTFYRSPSPGQPPFVQVGDVVEDGQQLGIIEAMKMLNAVEADTKGRVVRVLNEDGATVDGGATLFVIEPIEG